jgi:hypothetical protein
MANCVNGIPNQVNFPAVGADDAYATDQKYVDTLDSNKKFSSGFKARHDILFNQLTGTNDNAVNVAYDGATNTVKVVFKLMLSHIFMTLKTCNKVFRGGQILITLNKDTANLYKAFNMDRTSITAAGETYKAIQTWPPSQAVAGAGWSKSFNNVASPWVDMSDPAGAYKMGNFTITWNDAMLYLRVAKPKDIIYGKLTDKYVPEDKPTFYDAITTVGTYTGLTTASTQTMLLGTTLANADYLVFAFQINQGTAVTEAAYTASVNNAPGLFIGASNGSRTTDGASNYSVFDSLNLQRSYLSYGTTNYPTTQIDSDWFSAHNSNLNVKLNQQLRKEYFGIDDGKESSPIIDSQNWLNLYPLYVIDLRPKQSTVADSPSVPSTNQLQLTFNGPIPNGVTMYYLFLGHRSFKMNNMTTEIVY